MKKIKFLIAFIALVTFTSCSSDDTISLDDQETYIRFTANGVDYEFLSIASVGSANFSLNGSKSVDGLITENMSIWFPLGFTTGTYQLTGDYFDPGDYKIFYDSEDIGVEGFAPSSGEVTISSISNEYIDGSFYFSGTKDAIAITVTSGTFRAYTLE